MSKLQNYGVPVRQAQCGCYFTDDGTFIQYCAGHASHNADYRQRGKHLTPSGLASVTPIQKPGAWRRGARRTRYAGSVSTRQHTGVMELCNPRAPRHSFTQEGQNYERTPYL